jgi:uncharacterized DUF497 family protein
METPAQPSFEWDADKSRENQEKHGVSFLEAQHAFADPNRLIFEDVDHSTPDEIRYYCLGKINARVCTVRFTYRGEKIRIFGAGYWRKERRIYEQRHKP